MTRYFEDINATTIKFVIIMLLLFSGNVSSAPKESDLNGVYIQKHPNFIFNYKTKKEDFLETEDCLELHSVKDNQLAFHFYVHGVNGHVCEMNGIAESLKSGVYEYREIDLELECVLRIYVSNDVFRLEDSSNNCHNLFCGMRAGIDDVKFSRKKTKRHQCGSLLR